MVFASFSRRARKASRRRFRSRLSVLAFMTKAKAQDYIEAPDSSQTRADRHRHGQAVRASEPEGTVQGIGRCRTVPVCGPPAACEEESETGSRGQGRSLGVRLLLEPSDRVNATERSRDVTALRCPGARRDTIAISARTSPGRLSGGALAWNRPAGGVCHRRIRPDRPDL